MKLLLRRRQQRETTGAVRFKLWGKLELDEAERSVIRKYDLHSACLVEADQSGLIRNAIGIFAACFILVLLISFRLTSFGYALILAAGIGAAVAWFYFDRFRETVFVKDLIHGRHFSCRSVVHMVKKEVWLQQVVSFLRQVMETSKYWDGEEPIDIPAYDKDIAKRIVAKGF